MSPVSSLLTGAPEAPEIPGVPRASRRREWVQVLAETWALSRTKLGLALFGFVLAVAVVGPFFAPYTFTEFAGPPFHPPTAETLLGTDYLGHDVLSRVLFGGRTVFTLSIAATVIGMVGGTGLGMFAGYASRSVDELIMRLLDVVLAFPMIVFVLMIVSLAGPKPWLIVLAVGIADAPRIARVARGATLEIVGRDFVQAAEALGTSRYKILFSEILPNIASPLLVESALRFGYTIATIAALSFLGFGLQPPAADWGLMINENRIGISMQPWAVFVPAVMISLLTVGASLVADGLTRAMIGIDRRTDVA